MNSAIKYLASALALGLVALSAAPLLAQDNPPAAPAPESGPPPPPPPGGRRGGNPQQMLQRLKDRLNLTDDQATKIQGLLKDQQAKMSALFNDDSLSREDRRTKMTDLRKAAHDQIRAVLTPDQQKIFDAMPMDGPRGRRRQGDDNSPPPAPPPPPPANNT